MADKSSLMSSNSSPVATLSARSATLDVRLDTLSARSATLPVKVATSLATVKPYHRLLAEVIIETSTRTTIAISILSAISITVFVLCLFKLLIFFYDGLLQHVELF